MALPIRDGNQSLTTLSTILVSNSHIPAHTVVSFGTQGITDIATAVSGVELGPNTLNALENITVTLGQVTITGGLTDAQLRASAVTVGGGVYLADAQSVIGSSIPPEVIQIGGKSLADSKLYPISVDSNGVQSIIGAVTASISGTPSVTFSQASVTFGTAVVTGSTSILNFPATQPVSIASVTIGNSITIGASSVTFNSFVGQRGDGTWQAISLQTGSNYVNALVQNSVTIGSGTVTLGAGTAQIGSVTIGNTTTSSAVFTKICGEIAGSGPNETTQIITDSQGMLYSRLAPANNLTADPVIYDPIGGGAYINVRQYSGTSITIGNSITIGTALPAGTNQIGSVTASGTVTANIGGIANSVTLPVRLNAEKYGEAPSGQDTLVVCNSSGMLLVDANSGGSSVLGFDGNAFVQVKQVSGSSVTIGNTVTVSISGTPSITFGLISGTVTANNSILTNVLQYDGSHYFLKVGGVATTGGTSFPVYVAGTVTANPTGTQTIAGTVTANVRILDTNSGSNVVFSENGGIFPDYGLQVGFVDDLDYRLAGSSHPFPISGTVTAGNLPISPFAGVNAQLVNDEDQCIGIDVPFRVSSWNNDNIPISGVVTVSNIQTVTVGSQLVNTTKYPTAFVGYDVTNGNWQAVPLSEDGDCVIVGNALGAFQASNPLPISGSVTAVNHQGTTVTTSNFTSTSPSTVLASANSSREVLTIFNEGAGNLHICAGATCTTIAYQVRLSAGDYYEVPINQTSLTHSAVFATAGTARVTQVS